MCYSVDYKLLTRIVRAPKIEGGRLHGGGAAYTARGKVFIIDTLATEEVSIIDICLQVSMRFSYLVLTN